MAIQITWLNVGSDSKNFVELGAEQIHGKQQPVYVYAESNGYLAPMPSGVDGFRTEAGHEVRKHYERNLCV